MSGLETLKRIEADMNAARAKMMADGREAIKEAFNEIFEQFPNLEAVRWTQYTPYFNDGDACEFGVHEFSAKLSNITNVRDEYDREGWVDSWTIKYCTDDYSDTDLSYENRNEKHPDLKIFDALSVIQRQEDLLETIYGDHVEVIITRDGTTEVENYDHD